MPDSINFVRERQRKLTKLEVQDQVWLKWSVIASGVTAVVTLVIVGVGFGLQYQVNRVKDEQTQLKKQVSSQQEVEKSYVIFANKLRMLKEIVDNRTDKQAAIAFFTQVFGDQALLREITFDGDERLVSFRIQSDDVFKFKRVMELLDSPQVREKYPNVTREELRRAGIGSYEVQVSINLGGKPSPKPVAPAAAASPTP